MTYTHGHHESVLRSHRWRTVDNSAAYLAPHLTTGISVLDLGCGPGTITADIGRRVAPGRVLGIDASAAVTEGQLAPSTGANRGSVPPVAANTARAASALSPNALA